ncbi:MAG TPA: hypothetical protein VJ736_09370 [Actinomycetota bacterium]|nr:hypothetical protein [Actinomycetota bacterium]
MTRSPDGHLSVDVLVEGAWQAGRTQMIGLRLTEGTRRLTDQQVARLID